MCQDVVWVSCFQFDVHLYETDDVVVCADGPFSPVVNVPLPSRRPQPPPSFFDKLKAVFGSKQQPVVGSGTLPRKSCGTIRVAVTLIVDLYMMNNAAIRVQAAVRARQQRRKYMQAKAARALAASSLSAAIARGGVDSAEAENAAAIMMQCAWRSRQARRKVIEYRQAKLMAEV
jgi:hypothetical protein